MGSPGHRQSCVGHSGAQGWSSKQQGGLQVRIEKHQQSRTGHSRASTGVIARCLVVTSGISPVVSGAPNSHTRLNGRGTASPGALTVGAEFRGVGSRVKAGGARLDWVLLSWNNIRGATLGGQRTRWLLPARPWSTHLRARDLRRLSQQWSQRAGPRVRARLQSRRALAPGCQPHGTWLSGAGGQSLPVQQQAGPPTTLGPRGFLGQR